MTRAYECLWCFKGALFENQEVDCKTAEQNNTNTQLEKASIQQKLPVLDVEMTTVSLGIMA